MLVWTHLTVYINGVFFVYRNTICCCTICIVIRHLLSSVATSRPETNIIFLSRAPIARHYLMFATSCCGAFYFFRWHPVLLRSTESHSLLFWLHVAWCNRVRVMTTWSYVMGWETSTRISVVRCSLMALKSRSTIFFFKAFVKKFRSRRLLKRSHWVWPCLVVDTVLKQTHLIVCNLFKHSLVHIWVFVRVVWEVL